MPRLQWFLVLLFTVTVLAEQTHAADEAAKPAEGKAAVFVDARRVLTDNDPFWGNLVFHPTEYLSTEWGEQHIALLRQAGAARKYVRIYNQPEDAAYLRDDGTVGYRWDHFDRRADLILFAPAFLATAVARLIDLKLNHDVRIGDMYLCLSGYEIERKRDFEGKRTASTLNGFDKPLLNGYRLLAKLGGQLVASRIEPSDVPVTAIAARDGDRQAAVLVTHFRHDLPKSDGPDTTVELTIDTAWPAGTQVTLHHWRIDQTHSNAYTVFRELGSPRPPTAEETATIKQRMNLEPLEAPRRLRLDGPVQLTFALRSNALSLIELVAE